LESNWVYLRTNPGKNNHNTMKLTKEQFLGILRHALTFVGGILIMKGIVDDGTFAEISGAALTLAGGIWSVVAKNK
jgi:hypothetical protein